MRKLILTSTLVAALTGCATVPAPLAGDYSPVTPQQAVAQSTTGQRVRWGGEIIKVEPKADVTCFEVLSHGLYADARPDRHDRSDGRFIACKPGFFDPAIYTKGRDVTVVGSIAGTQKHRVGEYDYTFPRVNADEVYMWPPRTPHYAYDPWMAPYYFDSAWNPWWWGPPVVIVRHTHH